MENTNEKYLLVGESHFEFGDHSPERMKILNANLKKIINERRALLAKMKTKEPHLSR